MSRMVVELRLCNKYRMFLESPEAILPRLCEGESTIKKVLSEAAETGRSGNPKAGK